MSARASSPSVLRKPKHVNRLLFVCASINDVTLWPFWKCLQMKQLRGVKDMAVLAFNSHGGSFEARLDGAHYHFKNYASVQGYQQDMLEHFLQRHHCPGRTYLVYGGHGMGDYLELETNKFALQVHELAAILGTQRQFEAIVFDACFMANLDCAYHLRHNTRFIGASEGYAWEPDTALTHHIFNAHNASAMSRFRDPRKVLEVIQKHYCTRAPRGDFSVLDTRHAAELRAFVDKFVMPRVYNRLTFYDAAQRRRLKTLAEDAVEAADQQFGPPGGGAPLPPPLRKEVEYLAHHITHNARGGCNTSSPQLAGSVGLSSAGHRTRQEKLLHGVQLEHALYPSEITDKHLIDLRSYLVDMAKEEEEAGASTTSRTFVVDQHGRTSSTPPQAPLSPLFFAPTGSATCAKSPFPPHSAHHGLHLLNQVVVQHQGPQAKLYGSHLGGLSLALHEFSPMSKPIEPWTMARSQGGTGRRHWRQQAAEFLRWGRVARVVEEEEHAPPPPSLPQQPLAQPAPACATDSVATTTLIGLPPVEGACVQQSG